MCRGGDQTVIYDPIHKKSEDKIKEWLDRPEQGYCIDRIKDQMTGFSGSKNICDFTFFKSPYLYYIESKSTYEDRFDFSLISDYQYRELLKKSRIDYVSGLVIILYLTYQRAFILNIKDIDYLIKEKNQKSLNIKNIDKWCIPYYEIQTIPSRKALLDYTGDWEHQIGW